MPGGAVDLRYREAEERRDDGRGRREHGRPGRPQRLLRRDVAVVFVVELLPVSGDDQERVVGAGAEHDDRHDRARLPVDGHPELRDPVADGARQDLGEDHGRERDEEEDRRAVDQDQQEDHERQRGQQQRAVDRLEYIDRVRPVAGAAGDLHLEAAARVRDLLAPELDRVEQGVALAVALDVGSDECRLAVLRADRADEGRIALGLVRERRGRARAALGLRATARRLTGLGLAGAAAARGRCCAVRNDAREALRREPSGVLDDSPAVGRGQAGLAPVHDHRRRQLAALELLGRLERLGRLSVAGEERCRLVVLRVGELAGQVGGAGGDEDRHQPDQEDDPLGPASGGDGEDRAAFRIHDRVGLREVP